MNTRAISISLLIIMFNSLISCKNPPRYSRLTVQNRKLTINNVNYRLDWAIVETPRETNVISLVLIPFNGVNQPNKIGLCVNSRKNKNGFMVYSPCLCLGNRELPIINGFAYLYISNRNQLNILAKRISIENIKSTDIESVISFSREMLKKRGALTIKKVGDDESDEK